MTRSAAIAKSPHTPVMGAVPTKCNPVTLSDGSPAGSTPQGKTILIVEDHVDTRRVLSRTLANRGFHVATAGSVASACEQFNSEHPDLIICDIGLPDGTGWELMKKLRSLGKVKGIAVSGYGMDYDQRRSREAGFMTHLTKPIDLGKLEKLIAESLGPTSSA